MSKTQEYTPDTTTEATGLQIKLGEPVVRGASVQEVPLEVGQFVEALYQRYEDNPDWWTPTDLGSDTQTDQVVAFARAYCMNRSGGRLTLKVRRAPGEPTAREYRVIPYVRRTR